MHLWKESNAAAVRVVAALLQKYINVGVYLIIKISVVRTVGPDVCIKKRRLKNCFLETLHVMFLFPDSDLSKGIQVFLSQRFQPSFPVSVVADLQTRVHKRAHTHSHINTHPKKKPHIQAHIL